MSSKYPPKFIDSVTDLIKSNLQNEGFGVQDLSEAFALSNSQIYRKIKQQTGYAPTQFIQKIRLEAAYQLIIHSDLLLSDIAYRVGFSTLSYFSRCFSAHYQYPPSSLREKN